MPSPALAQRTLLDDDAHVALRLPLGETFGTLHPGGSFPLVEDPRRTTTAVLVGMMVLRPASRAWLPEQAPADLASSISSVRDWCFDVEGIGGSWPVSGGNRVDALRLALQYGVMDAVMAGAATVRREGLAMPGRRAHLWQPYTPLAWPALREWRERLAPAIAELRRQWQQLGVLSARRWPAQVAVSPSGDSPEALLGAAIFRERHPDGSAIESYVLTSEAGAARLREAARKTGRRLEDALLVASPDGDPASLDVARVPALLRERLGACLVEHDGGALSLGAFVEAGACRQLNLTLMRRRTVRDVLAASDRLDDDARREVLGDWPRRARLFPPGGGALPRGYTPFYAVAEAAEGGEAVAVSFDVRAR